MLAQLEELLKKHDIKLEIAWNTPRYIKNDHQWFYGKQFEVDSRTYYQAWFGDYRNPKVRADSPWISEPGEELTPGQKAAVTAKRNLIMQEQFEAQQRDWEDNALKASDEFDTFSDRGTTPYLEKKKLGSASKYGLRIKDNEHKPDEPILVVPLRDIDGRLWNYQRIFGSKLSRGDKFFYQGARKESCFHLVTDNEAKLFEFISGSNPAEIFIAEGIATAATISDALGPDAFVVCAFDAGNLLSVAQAIRSRHPNSAIVFCADNDAINKDGSRRLEADNAGIDKARIAAGTVDGTVVYPTFKNQKYGQSDFNDLAFESNLGLVRDQILNPSKYAVKEPVYSKIIDGKKKGPSTNDVAKHVLKAMGDNIIRDKSNMYKYNGLHWSKIQKNHEDLIKQEIDRASGGVFDVTKIKQAYEYLRIYVPQMPEHFNIYQPNPYMANFQNGTLHIDINQMKPVFREHSRTNYLMSVLPFDFPLEVLNDEYELPPAPQFEAMLDRLYQGEKDAEQKKTFLVQVMGCALTPAFPMIVMFIGKPNSGKSTIIKLIVNHMLDASNVSNVAPSDMTGFRIGAMIGKLVNYDAEMDVNAPMIDTVMKKVYDRSPISMDIKFEDPISAPVPALHLFAGNSVPPSNDPSGAYKRRLAIIKTEGFQAGSTPDLNFEANLWKAEGPAILARAIKGLLKVVANGGHYDRPESSAALIDELKTDSNLVEQFVDAARHGEVVVGEKNSRLLIDPKAWIERSQLWPTFNIWQREHSPQQAKLLSASKLYQRLEYLGFRPGARHGGTRGYHGLGPKTDEDSVV